MFDVDSEQLVNLARACTYYFRFWRRYTVFGLKRGDLACLQFVKQGKRAFPAELDAAVINAFFVTRRRIRAKPQRARRSANAFLGKTSSLQKYGFGILVDSAILAAHYTGDCQSFALVCNNQHLIGQFILFSV